MYKSLMSLKIHIQISDGSLIRIPQYQDLHLPQANLTVYQKGVYYAGIKMFNKLPNEIKGIYSNFKRFTVVY
jgi:hypothetical protein